MLEPLPPFQPHCNLLWLSQCQELSHFGIDRVIYRNIKRKAPPLIILGIYTLIFAWVNAFMHALCLLSCYFATNDKSLELRRAFALLRILSSSASNNGLNRQGLGIETSNIDNGTDGERAFSRTANAKRARRYWSKDFSSCVRHTLSLPGARLFFS